MIEWLGQGWSYLLVACSGISVVCVAGGYLAKAVKAVQQPRTDIEKKLDEAAEQHRHYDQCLARDKRKLDLLEESTSLMLRGQMDLIAHQLDGNHTAQMKKDREDIQQYLIDRTLS